MTTLDASFASVVTPAPAAVPATRSRRAVWSGRVLTGLALAFLTWDTLFKLTVNPMAVEGTAALGYPAHSVQIIGIVEALCLLLYVVPRTAVVGAVLWTGYLGGAVATHVRLDNPLFSHTLFPIYMAALLWGGLALRDKRVLPLLARPEGGARPKDARTAT
jgi:hypothetical protein